MKKRKFTPRFKTKVVLEALKEHEPLNVIAQKYKLQPSQISGWKKIFLDNADSVFGQAPRSKQDEETEERNLFLKTIGELKMENDFLKKSLC